MVKVSTLTQEWDPEGRTLAREALTVERVLDQGDSQLTSCDLHDGTAVKCAMRAFCNPPGCGRDARLASPELRRERVEVCKFPAGPLELAAILPEVARAGVGEAAVAARDPVGPSTLRRRFHLTRSVDVKVQLVCWAELADPKLPVGVAANFHVNSFDAFAD